MSIFNVLDEILDYNTVLSNKATKKNKSRPHATVQTPKGSIHYMAKDFCRQNAMKTESSSIIYRFFENLKSEISEKLIEIANREQNALGMKYVTGEEAFFDDGSLKMEMHNDKKLSLVIYLKVADNTDTSEIEEKLKQLKDNVKKNFPFEIPSENTGCNVYPVELENKSFNTTEEVLKNISEAYAVNIELTKLQCEYEEGFILFCFSAKINYTDVKITPEIEEILEKTCIHKYYA